MTFEDVLGTVFAWLAEATMVAVATQLELFAVSANQTASRMMYTSAELVGSYYSRLANLCCDTLRHTYTVLE